MRFWDLARAAEAGKCGFLSGNCGLFSLFLELGEVRARAQSPASCWCAGEESAFGTAVGCGAEIVSAGDALSGLQTPGAAAATRVAYCGDDGKDRENGNHERHGHEDHHEVIVVALCAADEEATYRRVCGGKNHRGDGEQISVGVVSVATPAEGFAGREAGIETSRVPRPSIFPRPGIFPLHFFREA